MRYYGKDGAQCQAPNSQESGALRRCRKKARAVLFGRGSPNSVIWLGLLAIVFSLGIYLVGVNNLTDGTCPALRDTGAAIMIRR